MQSWMVLGLVISFPHVVEVFLEDSFHTVQVKNPFLVWMVVIDLVAKITLRNVL